MTRSLDRLLRPKSIAVIGGREAERVIEQALAMGFKGEIWPVHPSKQKVCGLACISSVADLPGEPDVAYIAINRNRTIDVLEGLAKIGAGGAICYASGFGETDLTGQDLQAALLRAAGDMPVIGPNCYGILNYADGIALWPDQHGGVQLADGQKGVAIITQSSNIAINITMQKRGLPLAYVLTAGNQAQTGLSDMALELLDDPRVSVLGLHIEGFDSIAGMEAVARKSRQLAKPVIAMKIGKSKQARQAAFTHTASIAGADSAAEAFLKRIGIARVHSLSCFLQSMMLLHVVGPLEGNSISSLSCSGGEAALMADAAIGQTIEFREMSAAEKQPVQAALGPLVTVSNPLDYHTYIWGDRVGLEATYSGMMRAGFDLNCLIMDFPRDDRCDVQDWQSPVDAWVAASQKTGANCCIISTLHENLSEDRAGWFCAHGIAPMMGIDETLDAIEAAADIGQSWRQPEFQPVMAPADLSNVKHDIFDEADSKEMLAQFGVNVPEGIRIETQGEIEQALETVDFPVALKALGIAHKTEQNAVRLNLCDQSTVQDAADKLFKLSDRLYLEAMVQKPAMELLVGILHDKQFGMAMTIATGGVMVEVYNDSQFLLLPATDKEIEQALRRLKSARLFDGFRGRAEADFDATVEAIRHIMKFAIAHRNKLNELDINPLIICEHGHGAVAADVLIEFGSRNND